MEVTTPYRKLLGRVWKWRGLIKKGVILSIKRLSAKW
jgi:hypothetical protein